jgi:hypothetical protein
MCGVQATIETPSATNALAIPIDTPRSEAPSSIPGKM